ncbi:hypothetical protein [Parabacteroides goldsteinii]
MADQFDIVDIVYDAIEPASTGFILYKDRSADGETKNHITVRMLPLNETEVVNKGVVNINIFVKNQSKGKPDRQLMKGTVRNIKSALRNIKPPFSMYWKSRIVWSESLGEAKEGFDCTNIRFEVITEKD